MINSKYNWKVAKFDATNIGDVDKIAKELKLSPIVAKILFERGYKNVDDVKHFLNPSAEELGDPFLFHDMEKAVERITKAIEDGEKITIYGDYDADGLTSTAIMYETLSEIGADVNYYVPNRFSDGYGPNLDAFTKIIDDGTKLIITVDNGVTGFEPVDFANQHGCDVIITDHHEIPKQGVPDAYAVVHARYPGAQYPFGYFSGAGVAFKVASALLDEIPQEFLDLVTIGTIADLVSLTGENRVLTKFGVKAIQDTQRPGLLKILENAKLLDKPINEHSIGFGIAPRLNALGRMDDANVGVELLTTLDDDVANKLAEQTEHLNIERRKLVTDIFKAACDQLDQSDNQDRNTIVVAGDGWHEGVVGIVASKLVDKYHKPTLVLGIDSKTGIAKGSGRSIEDFNLFAALEPAKDLMLKFGGHDMAVGLSIKKDNLSELADEFEKNFKLSGNEKNEKPVLKVDAKISVDQVDDLLYESLSQLAPYGTDNPQPLFEIRPKLVNNLQTMGNQNAHLRFSANGNQNRIKAVAFGMGSKMNSIQSNSSSIDVVATIEMNTWNNVSSLRLMVKDLKSSGVEIIDQRSRNLNPKMLKLNGTYVLFNKRFVKELEPYINEKSNIIWYNDLSKEKLADLIIIVDFPDTIDELKHVIKYFDNNQVVLYLFKQHFVYESGFPTREYFGALFKMLSGSPAFNINQSLNQIAAQLGIDRNLVIFMIKVFQELQFVSINNGILSMNSNLQKQDLKSTEAYRNRELQLALEKQLLLPNSANLIAMFNDLMG